VALEVAGQHLEVDAGTPEPAIERLPARLFLGGEVDEFEEGCVGGEDIALVAGNDDRVGRVLDDLEQLRLELERPAVSSLVLATRTRKRVALSLRTRLAGRLQTAARQVGPRCPPGGANPGGEAGRFPPASSNQSMNERPTTFRPRSRTAGGRRVGVDDPEVPGLDDRQQIRGNSKSSR
jgi:hypothetical protein